MSGTKGMLHYSQGVKQDAIRLFLNEGYTYHQIAEQLGIRKAEQIEKWVHQFRKDGELIFKKFSGRTGRWKMIRHIYSD